MIKEQLQRIKEFEAIMLGAYPSPEHVAQMREYFEKIGFFSAPASAGHHGNYAGGLFDHSLTVTKALVSLTERLGLPWGNKRSPYIVGMFHDLCKVDQYVEHLNGTFEYNNDLLLDGHGEKSVIMLQRYMNLTEEEMLCIRWHMGAFDEKENWRRYTKAVEAYPTVLYTHTADMVASQILGV